MDLSCTPYHLVKGISNMSLLGVRVFFQGAWRAADQALKYLENRMDKALQDSVKEESTLITKMLKENLNRGGRPKFQPVSSFTKVIRKASGNSSRKPGVSTRQVLKGITSTKIDKITYFAGILKGKSRHKSNGMDLAEVAWVLEKGRGPLLLELDRVSAKSGKTPRQWLWWLYLSGAPKSRPSKRKTHIQIGASKPRPFVGQVEKRERDKITKRMVVRAINKFEKTKFPPDIQKVAAQFGIPI